MPNPKLTYLDLSLSKMIMDEVSTAFTDGSRVNASIRLNALNLSRYQVFNMQFEKVPLKDFINLFPYSHYIATINTTPLPDYVYKVLSCFANNKLYEEIPPLEVLKALKSSYSLFKPTSDLGKFYINGPDLKLYETTTPATVEASILKYPTALSNTDEVPEPYHIFPAILQFANEIILKNLQFLS